MKGLEEVIFQYIKENDVDVASGMTVMLGAATVFCEAAGMEYETFRDAVISMVTGYEKIWTGKRK